MFCADFVMPSSLLSGYLNQINKVLSSKQLHHSSFPVTLVLCLEWQRRRYYYSPTISLQTYPRLAWLPPNHAARMRLVCKQWPLAHRDSGSPLHAHELLQEQSRRPLHRWLLRQQRAPQQVQLQPPT
uniref:Uncharacterized protein n=1 Tax=Leersia perrieri TaxID=77586 RepID=A0A0D9VIL5_9ORYZ